MNSLAIKFFSLKFLSKSLKYVLYCVNDNINQNDYKKSAIVFAPHPDDETLGCGGTIIKKKRFGAEIKIVFMTDGARSHPHLISETELKSIRAREAVAASKVMGIAKDEVFFLEFEDGELSNNIASAAEKVIKILSKYKPKEIYIPYYRDRDPNLDHIAANKIVRLALRRHDEEVIVYEYPIWVWNNWPWVSVSKFSSDNILKVLINGLVSTYNLLRDLRCSVYVGDVLGIKRASLYQHKSQTTRLISDSSWWTLGDWSGGEFLQCFFQKYEFFHRYRHPQKY